MSLFNKIVFALAGLVFLACCVAFGIGMVA